jgi:hypothetical protein
LAQKVATSESHSNGGPSQNRKQQQKRVRPAVSTAVCSSARVLKPQSPERTAQAQQEEEEEEKIRAASMERHARQSEGAAMREVRRVEAA